MKRQLSDYLNFYLGCEVKLMNWFLGDTSQKILTGCETCGVFPEARLVFYYPNYAECENNTPASKSACYSFPMKDVKPMLRPLSDISENERKELWLLIFGKPFNVNGTTRFYDKRTTSSEPHWVLMSGVERLGIELNGTVWADSDLQIFKHNQHEVTRWFLSKHFDLFDLIKSGLAIGANGSKSHSTFIPTIGDEDLCSNCGKIKGLHYIEAIRGLFGGETYDRPFFCEDVFK